VNRASFCFAVLLLASSLALAPIGAQTGGITYGANQNFSAIGWPPFSGFTVSKIHIENAGSGDITLFTVPAGKRAIAALIYYNSAGTTTTFFDEVKINGAGAFRRLRSNLTAATNAVNSSGEVIIMEAGDVYALNTSQAGMNVFGEVLTFDNTSGLKSPRLTTMTSGNNTLFTCCSAGKTIAYAIGTPSYFFGSSNAPLGSYVNTTGGTLSYSWNIVNSGGSPGTANKLLPVTSTLTNVGNVVVLSGMVLTTGDFVSVNTTGSGAGNDQLAWIVIMEI
jgi:hypothetical protein